MHLETPTCTTVYSSSSRACVGATWYLICALQGASFKVDMIHSVVVVKFRRTEVVAQFTPLLFEVEGGKLRMP